MGNYTLQYIISQYRRQCLWIIYISKMVVKRKGRRIQCGGRRTNSCVNTVDYNEGM